jgi:hypothetical protein
MSDLQWTLYFAWCTIIISINLNIFVNKDEIHDISSKKYLDIIYLTILLYQI